MYNGMVNWFNTHKGFGYIINDAAGEEVFVHFSAINGRFMSLEEGQKVTLEIETDPNDSKKMKAKIHSQFQASCDIRYGNNHKQ